MSRRHVILGGGNLSWALEKELTRVGDEVKVLSRTLGNFEYPLPYRHDAWEEMEDADTVWCCIGAGSVEQANENVVPFIDLHVRLPLELIQRLQGLGTKVVLFSTDFLNEFDNGVPVIRSSYALSKYHMETMALMLGFKGLIFRVGSLYGGPLESKTFPGKIAKKLLAGEEVTVPGNPCNPTPVNWLASRCVAYERDEGHKGVVVPLTSRGEPSVFRWAQEIADSMGLDPRIIKRTAPLENRPNSFTIKPPKTAYWDALWRANAKEFYPWITKLYVEPTITSPSP